VDPRVSPASRAAADPPRSESTGPARPGAAGAALVAGHGISGAAEPNGGAVALPPPSQGAEPAFMPGYLVAFDPGFSRPAPIQRRGGSDGPGEADAVRAAGPAADGAPGGGTADAPGVDDWAVALNDPPPHADARAGAPATDQFAPAAGDLAAAAAAECPTDDRARPRGGWWQCLPLCLLLVLWDRRAGGRPGAWAVPQPRL
jgi:hypothetical protein